MLPGRLLAGALLALAASIAHAQATPVGLWKTVDDNTKKATSMVRISDAGGVLGGRIEQLIEPAQPEPRCEKCEGAEKDQPIVGLGILRNVKQDPEDKSLWSGGDILDPNNGKRYKVRLKPIDGGAKLEVRGYIGTPLLGRTQTWIRVE